MNTVTVNGCRRCAMCDVTGQRWDPATHCPVTPYTSCDHITDHRVVVAELTAADDARDAARAVADATRPPVRFITRAEILRRTHHDQHPERRTP